MKLRELIKVIPSFYTVGIYREDCTIIDEYKRSCVPTVFYDCDVVSVDTTPGYKNFALTIKYKGGIPNEEV